MRNELEMVVVSLHGGRESQYRCRDLSPVLAEFRAEVPQLWL
jgi:hypothetical protein